eukprot:5596889-Alexandrium_andersonii.AAC.1
MERASRAANWTPKNDRDTCGHRHATKHSSSKANTATAHSEGREHECDRSTTSCGQGGNNELDNSGTGQE